MPTVRWKRLSAEIFCACSETWRKIIESIHKECFMGSALCRLLIACALLGFAAPERHSLAASATTSMRVLYPSFAGSWATSWIAKEAGYFAAEGLDVELIRVGGSTRMV